jgi:hypothetical protein
MKALRLALLLLAGQDLVGALVAGGLHARLTALLFATSALAALGTWRLTHWFEAATDRWQRCKAQRRLRRASAGEDDAAARQGAGAGVRRLG